MNYKNCVIFGGAGYIGSFFAAYLLESGLVNSVVLADITKKKEPIWPVQIRQGLKSGTVRYIECDVREITQFNELSSDFDLICNFAAIHREPGHADEEYFETNILGAENVTKWAESISCHRIIFTSSIAPYGVLEREKRESTLPVPVTAYGASKLVAEKIHIAWQNRDINNRYLSIVRPGVIYGPGEDGNVPRMIRAVKRGYFFYTGNQDTRKAGGYIKELVIAMHWVIHRQEAKAENVVLYNFTSKVAPTISEYVTTIQDVLGKRRFVLSLPYSVLLAASYVIDLIAKPFGLTHPFNHIRIRKLIKSNDVIPSYLISNGYKYKYNLNDAFQDWKESTPDDWLVKD